MENLMKRNMEKAKSGKQECQDILKLPFVLIQTKECTDINIQITKKRDQMLIQVNELPKVYGDKDFLLTTGLQNDQTPKLPTMPASQPSSPYIDPNFLQQFQQHYELLAG